MTRAILATALLMGAAPWAAADEVLLKGGGRIVGEVMERTPKSVLLDVGPGTVRVPMERVERIVDGSSHLAEFRNRASRIAQGDVAGWLALAAWADQNGLRTQAREAWEHVLSIEPGNATAHHGLGNVLHAGHWMRESDAMRAQGLVEFEGRWISMAEREAILRSEAAESVARRESALADARIAEAEARAREAEARAHAAEVDAARAGDSYDDGGIPLDYVYGGYGGYGVGGVGVYPPVGVFPPVQPCCGGGRGHGGGGRGHGGGGRGHGGGRRHDDHPDQSDRNSQASTRATPATRAVGTEGASPRAARPEGRSSNNREH